MFKDNFKNQVVQEKRDFICQRKLFDFQNKTLYSLNT